MEKLRLSKQAAGALMMCLQKCLVEEVDIIPILEGLELQNTEDGLLVTNPPQVHFKPEQLQKVEEREESPSFYCDHANENPVTCVCPSDCYCKNHTCEGR